MNGRAQSVNETVSDPGLARAGTDWHGLAPPARDGRQHVQKDLKGWNSVWERWKRTRHIAGNRFEADCTHYRCITWQMGCTSCERGLTASVSYRDELHALLHALNAPKIAVRHATCTPAARAAHTTRDHGVVHGGSGATSSPTLCLFQNVNECNPTIRHVHLQYSERHSARPSRSAGDGKRPARSTCSRGLVGLVGCKRHEWPSQWRVVTAERRATLNNCRVLSPSPRRPADLENLGFGRSLDLDVDMDVGVHRKRIEWRSPRPGQPVLLDRSEWFQTSGSFRDHSSRFAGNEMSWPECLSRGMQERIAWTQCFGLGRSVERREVACGRPRPSGRMPGWEREWRHCGCVANSSSCRSDQRRSELKSSVVMTDVHQAWRTDCVSLSADMICVGNGRSRARLRDTCPDARCTDQRSEARKVRTYVTGGRSCWLECLIITKRESVCDEL